MPFCDRQTIFATHIEAKTIQIYTIAGGFNPFEKYVRQNGLIFPKYRPNRGENSKHIWVATTQQKPAPTPSFWWFSSSDNFRPQVPPWLGPFEDLLPTKVCFFVASGEGEQQLMELTPPWLMVHLHLRMGEDDKIANMLPMMICSLPKGKNTFGFEGYIFGVVCFFEQNIDQVDRRHRQRNSKWKMPKSKSQSWQHISLHHWVKWLFGGLCANMANKCATTARNSYNW